MGIFDNITGAAERFILSRVKNNSLFAEYYARNDKSASYTKQAINYQTKQINDWKIAVMAATDPENPRHGLLMRFYQSLMLDLHLSGIIDTRILRVQRSSFIIQDKDGNENTELKELLERPWYEDLVRLVVGKTFQGTTLIEIFDTDENGELAAVSEIPKSNFIPSKGIIIKEEYDDKGISYREGFYRDYYVQVGRDHELGMLMELALMVLAKKLGLGSLVSYIDKYGVPPIFATTDRLDNTRRDELFNMLANFKQNHFAVLQGNEKIESPVTNKGEGYNMFKGLICDICNTEMSKRVLGGTATVDEKSFVGSAQVQESVAKDRHEADKLLFKYYFNTHIRHRLAKISSVYAGFATHTLVWDNQETLDIESYIDGVEKLSDTYTFDVDEIRKRTGLPITGLKVQPSQEPPAPNAGGQKKKSDPNAIGNNTFPSVYATAWDAVTDRIAEQVYENKIKPEDLDKDIVMKNYDALNKSASSGWGKGYDEESLPRKLRENILMFSGAKSHRIISKLAELKKLCNTKEEFLGEAKKLTAAYSGPYLKTESKFAANSASSARDFEAYKEDADIYPCLKYRTMGDDDVRDSHVANNGIIKPIAEWKVIPPLDPGCRCWLEQTVEPPTLDRHLKHGDDKWANNPSMSGEIFTSSHSYFASIAKADALTVRHNSERMKHLVPYNTSMPVGKNKIYVSDFADYTDLTENIDASKQLSQTLNKDIWIRPHVYDISGYKNPELGIGKSNEKGDLKTYHQMANGKPVTLASYVTNSLKSANGQGAKHLVLDISNYKGDIVVDLSRRLCGGTNKINSNIQNVIVIKGSKVSEITRQQIDKRQFDSFFKALE